MGNETVTEEERLRQESQFGDAEEEKDEFDGKKFGKIKRFFSHFKKPSKKTVILLIAAVVVIIAAAAFIVHKMSGSKEEETQINTATVERRTITKTVDGSSVVEANDTYNISALVTGEILSDTFSEGDLVKKDQLLYKIDSSDAQKDVDTAKNNLAKAQQTYADAVRTKSDTIKTNSISEETQKNAIEKALNDVDTANRALNLAQEGYNDLAIVSNYSGTVGEILLDEGDLVLSSGMQIASIYDQSRLKIQVPFNESETGNINVGDTAQLTIASTGEKIDGTVENVGEATEGTSAHAVIKYVTIVVDNPGGLTTQDQASAVINGVACNNLGTFEYYKQGYIESQTGDGDGEYCTIKELYIKENDVVTAGEVVGYLASSKTENDLEDAKTKLESAELSRDDAYKQLESLVIQNDEYKLDSTIQTAQLDLDNARIQLEQAQEKLDDYEITAPIEGTIITKNKKAGDKLENNSDSTEPMAVIYDMSTLKVQLSVDESDIKDIAVGQEVSITADAVADKQFTGTVTKVGVNGTAENGVTTYPVDIVIEDYGDLLPGMNVDCVINVKSAENVLAIPSEALQRGNIVYVQGDKTDENDKAPEGFHSVDVETGTADAQYIEITSGLNEGDTVYTSMQGSGLEAQGSEEDSMSGMNGGMGGGMGGGMSGGMGGGAPGGMSGGGAPGGGPR